jgi:hypothetical protein
MSRYARFLMPVAGAVIVCLLLVASAQATHPRPKSALPFYTSFVPAYEQCTAPNRTHGPPLAFPSCNPPAHTSGQATMGTPDAFGGPANGTASLRISAYVGVPGPPDEADMLLKFLISDVRCVPTGARCAGANASGSADYAGDLRFSFDFRLSDHYNAVAPGGGTDPATVQDFPFESGMVCAQTASTGIGSTCDWQTSSNVIIPGWAKETKRSIYELDAVRIYDGGADGDSATTADNTLFLRQGIFIP